MALRNQPYLPLYIQDYLTDEKLSMCSWATQGIYIKLLCVLHKSEPYGCILLKQNDKQTPDVCLNFALKIMRLLPIEKDVLISALTELIAEGCLIIEDDKLLQKRMVRDNEISNIRAKAGKIGGKQTQLFAKAKSEANTENENEIENIDIDEIEDKSIALEKRCKNFIHGVFETGQQYPETMLNKFCDYWTELNKSKTKMRFEGEKYFDVKRRLNTWASREKTDPSKMSREDKAKSIIWKE